MRALSGLQRAFVDAWLENGFNGVEAARTAGYHGNNRSLYVMASRNLTKPHVRAEIDRRWAAHGVSPEEVMARLVEQARGTMGDFLRFDEDGTARLDLDVARAAGKLHLIKSLKWTQHGGVSIELYSSKDALDSIARSLGMFKDRLSLESGGREIPIREVIVNLAHDEPDTQPVEG